MRLTSYAKGKVRLADIMKVSLAESHIQPNSCALEQFLGLEKGQTEHEIRKMVKYYINDRSESVDLPIIELD